jgi:hypothetical protein
MAKSATMQSDEPYSNGNPEIQAKEAAIRKVAKLLPLPDSLFSLKKIRDDYASRVQVMVHSFLVIHCLFLLVIASFVLSNNLSYN